MGTRAVDRHDDDYTRVIALNAPLKRPEGNFSEAKQHSQRKVDVLDLKANQLLSKSFGEIIQQSPELPVDLFTSRDDELALRAKQSGMEDAYTHVLTFDQLLKKTPIIGDMREMLREIQDAYEYPVDVEFAANFLADGSYKINVLQCRPFQYKASEATPPPQEEISPDKLVLEARGAVIGQSRVARIDRFVYVVPEYYGQLPIAKRHGVARLIGQINRRIEKDKPGAVMLLGPGRWGTTTPSLGVPIRFSDINAVSVLCEIVTMREGVVPEVSLGTHLFNEMVEMDMLYLALFPNREGNFLNKDLLEKAPNRLCELLPDAADWSDTVRVIDAVDLDDGANVMINASVLDQRVLCYLKDKSG